MIRSCTIFVGHDCGDKVESNYPFSLLLSHSLEGDYTLFTSLDTVHVAISLAFYSLPLEATRTRSIERCYTHFGFIVSFSFRLLWQTSLLFHCYPPSPPSAARCSFYARQDGFPFHRFQSLTVYCIVIMLM
jgi:hypothetical protein